MLELPPFAVCEVRCIGGCAGIATNSTYLYDAKLEMMRSLKCFRVPLENGPS
jgi:hypothetical protein